MRRAFYSRKPSALEPVGNGNWLYRRDIRQEEPRKGIGLHGRDGQEGRPEWSCLEVTVIGSPSYGGIVEAVIRSRYSVSEELAMVNKYNARMSGAVVAEGIEEEYAEYLKWVDGVKRQAREDLSAAGFNVK